MSRGTTASLARNPKLVFDIFTVGHGYGALEKWYANLACPKTKAIKILGTTRVYIDGFLKVGKNKDRLIEGHKEDLEDVALDFRI